MAWNCGGGGDAQQLYGNPAGRRVLRNAIIAYGVLLAACATDPPKNRASGDEAANIAADVSEKASALRLTLDEKALEWLETYDVPSVAVAYVEDGQLAWTAVYGEQSAGVPATEETLYNIASMTKPITAETILRLVSDRKISLDEPMSAHWIDPDIAGNPWHDKLTPAIALSHRTGFINWRFQTNDTLEFLWEPGTKTGYSGEGYNYVARFAEKKLGQPFEALAQDMCLIRSAWRIRPIRSATGSRGALQCRKVPRVNSASRISR